MTAHGLIDTTEMYLKAVFELDEEGIVPLRARIAERLRQSGPTVSQTVARMERDGLLRVEGDRHLEFSPRGREYATSVMRKHRLAEVLLLDVIKLDWAQVHVEACRWEHVMSEDVERRIVALCDTPRACPHGNPIPGLGELGVPDAPALAAGEGELVTAAAAVAPGERVEAVVRRVSERVQEDVELMGALYQRGALPGARVTLVGGAGGRTELRGPGGRLLLDPSAADALAVSLASVPAHAAAATR